MKKIITLITLLLINVATFAQAPQKMSYQAVVRNASGDLVVSTTIGTKISILQSSASGSAVYVETHTATTNANGLVSLEIGTGSLVSGDFSTIDWSTGDYYIKSETDVTGGTSYTISGTSQLLSVPYALYAGSAPGGLSAGSAAGNTPYWNGSTWITTNNTLYNDGSNIGIGTTSPSAKLDVSGTVRIADGTQGAGKILTSDATGLASWSTASASVPYYEINSVDGVPSSPFPLGDFGTMVTFAITNNCILESFFGGTMLINKSTGNVKIINYAAGEGGTMSASGNVVTILNACGTITITFNVSGNTCTITSGAISGIYIQAKLTILKI